MYIKCKTDYTINLMDLEIKLKNEHKILLLHYNSYFRKII